MKLNENQITYIENVIRKSKIKYYEVFIEILDHMILSVESIMQNDNNIVFEDAVKQAKFESFKNIEFSVIEKNKKEELRKFYTKDYIKQIKSFFTIPKIFLTLIIYSSCFIYLTFFGVNKLIFILILVFPVFIILIDNVFYHYKYKKIKKLEMFKINVFAYYCNFIGLGMNMHQVILNSITNNLDMNSLVKRNIYSLLFTFTIITFIIYLKIRNKTINEIKLHFS